MALTPLRPTDPSNLGPYRLQGRLGAGGMGVVYLAFGADNHPVALKVSHPFHPRGQCGAARGQPVRGQGGCR